jgi:hypothetical protein
MLANALPRALAPDFAEVVPLALWVNEPTVLLSREKSVRNLEDLAGMTVRAADPVSARVLSLWGATPSTMPANQVLGALKNGTVDAALIGPSTVTSFQLGTVTRSVTVNLPTLLTSFYLLMNKASWDQLPPGMQTVLKAATGRSLASGATSAYEKAGGEGLLALAGAESNVLSAAEKERFALAARLVISETILDLASKGIDGQKILDTFRPRLHLVRDGGSFQIQLQGGDSLAYQLFRSADLKGWLPVSAQTAGADGKLSWSPALDSNANFFRVQVP